MIGDELYDFRCAKCGEPLDRVDDDRLCLRCWSIAGEPEEGIGEPAVMCTTWDSEPEIPGCGRVVLTQKQYERQLFVSSKTWRCPNCRREAEWVGTGIYE